MKRERKARNCCESCRTISNVIDRWMRESMCCCEHESELAALKKEEVFPKEALDVSVADVAFFEKKVKEKDHRIKTLLRQNSKYFKDSFKITFKEYTKQKKELEDIKTAHENTMKEVCGSGKDDRQHCSCVPFLREEIKKLQGGTK